MLIIEVKLAGSPSHAIVRFTASVLTGTALWRVALGGVVVVVVVGGGRVVVVPKVVMGSDG